MATRKKTEIVEVVAKCDNLIPESEIENMIFSIRGIQVMVDRDLATLYGVETKVLNQAVKRNISRFPERFRFQLSQDETTELVTNCDRLQNLKHSSIYPHVFTEQGVAMLSSVLNSPTAIAVCIQIMDAFVASRHFALANAEMFQRLELIEQNAHDRFLCIDDTVYHIGASLKDLGKKWFAFGRMELGTDTLLQKM